MPWITAFIRVNYSLYVDGLSLALVALTTLMTPLCLLYSFALEERPKEYFALFLLLEVGMLGTFLAVDFFLFYVFWEISLVPMYFIIGIWGGPRREYAAIKFFLYTLVGSVLMLLGLLWLYFNSAPVGGMGTFDFFELQRSPELREAIRTNGAIALLVWGNLPCLRDQGARLAVPYLAAGRARRGAHRGQRDPGGRPAEDGRVRDAARPAADPAGAVLPDARGS